MKKTFLLLMTIWASLFFYGCGVDTSPATGNGGPEQQEEQLSEEEEAGEREMEQEE